MNGMPPKISVIMPAYNSANYIAEAIQSILTQTVSDFELIIIDDGSTDNTCKIAEAFSDARIRIIKNQTNLGIVRTINRGLSEAAGEYIARMDADDSSYNDRFARQIDYMEKNPDCSVLGTWFVLSSGEIVCHPITHQGIKDMLLIKDCAIGHPTVMIRSNVFKDGGVRYPRKFPHAEDYALWCLLIDKYQFANIPEPLLWYRIHPQQVSNKFRQQQRKSAVKSKIALLTGSYSCYSWKFLRSLRKSFESDRPTYFSDLMRMAILTISLIVRNILQGKFSRRTFIKFVLRRCLTTFKNFHMKRFMKSCNPQ
jgi:glycosyltransferase involved in cell wall biosynthesis